MGAELWAGGRVLWGSAILSASPPLAELAGRVGFDVVWIEVEHGTAGWGEVQTLCMAAEAGGAAPAVRVAGAERESVLRALEAGARLVVVPMVNDAHTARQLVEWGKFPPLGLRGYNTRSRGVGYGLLPPPEAFPQANARTHLIAQIETVEAVRNLEEICAVEGLAGVLIGPGDLSVSAGKTGQFGDPDYIKLVTDCVRKARLAGKHAGILVAPGLMLEAAIEAGCDLAFIAGDVSDLARAWSDLLSRMRPEK